MECHFQFFTDDVSFFFGNVVFIGFIIDLQCSSQASFDRFVIHEDIVHRETTNGALGVLHLFFRLISFVADGHGLSESFAGTAGFTAGTAFILKSDYEGFTFLYLVKLCPSVIDLQPYKQTGCFFMHVFAFYLLFCLAHSMNSSLTDLCSVGNVSCFVFRKRFSS